MQDFEINQWLLDLLKLDPGRSQNYENIALEDWQNLLDKAIEQQVGALLYFQLQSLPDLRVPSVIQESLKNIYRKNTFFNMALVGELKSILNIFNSNEIPVIVLKGAYIAKEIYPKIGLREMVDIDFLVPDDKVEQAAKLLEILDYKSIRKQGVLLDIEQEFSHQLPPFRKSFTLPVVEIHWTTCKPDKNYQFDLTEFWQRATPTDFFGEMALALAPEDLILHLCHHASYHHLFDIGVRPLCDLARIIEHFRGQLNWEALQMTAERWQWEKGLYLMLGLIHRYFDVILPATIMKSIEYYGIDTEMLAIAESELLENRKLSKALNVPFTNFIEQPNFINKIKLMIQRMFISPRIMSRMYPVKPHYTDPKLYFYYLIRFRDLWQRYYKNIQKSIFGDIDITSVTERKYLLNQWLQEKSK